VLTVCPPEITPTLSVMPFGGSLSACSASVLCASSLMALMPASKLAPECAALPVISKRMNRQPLRPVTAAPRARPGSELKQTRVAVAHQQDRAIAKRRRVLAHGGRDGVAERLVRRNLGSNAVFAEELPNMAACGIDTGLVVGATVGVHQRLQQRQHGVALTAQP